MFLSRKDIREKVAINVIQSTWPPKALNDFFSFFNAVKYALPRIKCTSLWATKRNVQHDTEQRMYVTFICRNSNESMFLSNETFHVHRIYDVVRKRKIIFLAIKYTK